MHSASIANIKTTFSTYRRLIIDVMEAEIGHLDNWPQIRSKLLGLLSDQRGLEARVTEVISLDEVSIP